MKIPKNCKLEKVASKDQTREVLNYILIENKNDETHAVATDGRRLAVVPVAICDEDQLDGEKLMLPKALTEARKQAKQAKESTIGLNGAALMPNGECYPVREDLNFPNWRQVVPTGAKYTKVCFNAKYLYELAQAIGCQNDCVQLQIEINPETGHLDPLRPLVIEDKTTGGKGVLMPMRP